MFNILVIEDDAKILDIVEKHLRRYSLNPVRLKGDSDIHRQVTELSPHLILLDINLPRYDGFYLCRQIRLLTKAPIIFMSARSSPMDQVFALENGGDDYIVKPFDLEVMLAKVHSWLRRTYGEYRQAEEPDVLMVHGLILKEDRLLLTYNHKQVDLSLTEMRLVRCLMRKCSSVVTRDELLEELWDDVSFVDDNTLSVNVARVRKKLSDLGLPDVLATKRGQGYVLEMGGER